MQRDTFIFRRKWYEAITGLDDKTKSAAFDRICQYALYHNTEEPQDPMVRMAMAFIVPDLVEDCEKWLGIKEKRSEAGKKHTGNQYTRLEHNGTNGTNVPTMEQNGTNGSVYVNVLQDTKVSMCNNISTLSTEVSKVDSSGSIESDDAISYKKLIDFWNRAFKGTCISRLSSIEGIRRKLTQARIKTYGKDKFADAIINASKSSYLTSGEVKWFSYDWFIKPNNFPKVLEGRYNNGEVVETKSIPKELLIDLDVAKNRYWEGDRTIVWVGDDIKHRSLTTKQTAQQYGLQFTEFRI